MTAEASARAYARAVYETAIGDWLGELRKAKQQLEAHRLIPELDDPRIPFEEKKRRLDEVLDTNTDQRIRNFLYTLASNNDLNLLEEVIEDYARLLRRGVEELPLAQVTTAIELTEEEKQRFVERLRRRFGEELDVTFHVDPSIIGGVIVRVGDKYIDGSVAGKLERMRERLVQ